MPNPQSILFVCLGNICRSPTAEGVARVRASERGLEVHLDSAGTGDWHIGHPPHGPAVAAALDRDVDLSLLRARQVSIGDFDRFDLIIATDRQNLRDLEAMRPAGDETSVRLMSEFASAGPKDVPDPYYTGDFEEALDIIEAAVSGLLDEIDLP